MSTSSTPESFHDYLGLCQLKAHRTRLIIFCGRSGSGKSTCMHWLERRWQAHRKLILIDEIIDESGLRRVRKAMTVPNATVLVASHVPPARHWSLLLGPGRLLHRLDRYPKKIFRRLKQRGVAFEDSTVHAFLRRFGANYTDLDLLLERYPELNFDQAWALFNRECAVQLEPTL